MASAKLLGDPRFAVWSVRSSDTAEDKWSRMTDVDTKVGVPNNADVSDSFNQVRRAVLGSPPFFDAVRLPDDFSPLPTLRLMPSYDCEFGFIRGWEFASPRMFGLLDTPKGTLQGFPVKTIWVGGPKPDTQFVWIPYMPRYPALDVAASDCEVEEFVDPNGGPARRQIRQGERLVLRQGLTPPFGMFRPAEMTFKRLVTDALAEAVLRSGCEDIEFVEVETCSSMDGPLRRRTRDGVELRPGGVENRLSRRLPVPEL